MSYYSNGGGCSVTPLSTMSLLGWNCRRLGNLRTVNALAKVVNKEEPIIVFLMETKLKKEWLDLIKEKCKMKNCFVVPSIGSSGGLIMWCGKKS